MIGADIFRCDAIAFHDIDGPQGRLDLGPTGEAQQKLATWCHTGHCRAGLASADGAQNVDPAFNGAVVVRRPADEREDRAGSEGHALFRARQDGFLGNPTETDPALDAPFDPGEVDTCLHRLSALAADRPAKWRHGVWRVERGLRSRPRSRSSRPS